MTAPYYEDGSVTLLAGDSDLFGGAARDESRREVRRSREGEASADRRYTERGGTNFAMTSGPRYDRPRPAPVVDNAPDLFGGAA